MKGKKTIQGSTLAIYSVSWGNLQLLFSTSSILKIIKLIKIILKKSLKKNMWGNIIAIHSVLKKKTTKLNS